MFHYEIDIIMDFSYDNDDDGIVRWCRCATDMISLYYMKKQQYLHHIYIYKPNTEIIKVGMAYEFMKITSISYYYRSRCDRNKFV